MCVFTLCDLSDAVWRTRGDKLTDPTQCCSSGEQTDIFIFDLEPVQIQSISDQTGFQVCLCFLNLCIEL